MADHSDHDAHWATLPGLIPPIIAAALFVTFLFALPTVMAGESLRFVIDWVPSLNTRISIFIDGLSLTFALLISGIGTLVMFYAAAYMAGDPGHGRFSLFLTSFMLAMLGLVLADNVLTLFVFWELTSITSFLLIGYSHADPASRRSAQQALLVTAGGGLAMLAGFILMGNVAGSFELSEIRGMGDVLRNSPLYLPILILVLLGAFTKSAQVPFHFWLPNAMAAPTPVSAYLHSATMVKGGVYLLARLHPSLADTPVWLWTLVIFGGVTTVFASIVAIRQTDLKQTLAYTTLMALGTLVMFLGAPGGYAITGLAVFLIVHSLYKAALFLVVGCIDHEAGTRDAHVLGGLARKMPISTASAILAGLSMAGIPPLVGFIAKEYLYSGALETPSSVYFVVGAAFAANALMVAAAGIVAVKPFFGSRANMDRAKAQIHEAPFPMLAGPLILGVLALYFGLFPEHLQVAITTPMHAAITGSADGAKELHLLPETINTPLILSGLTLAAGIAIYLLHRLLRRGLAGAERRLISFDRIWDGILGGGQAGAGALTRVVQSGKLTSYMLATYAVIAAAVIAGLIRGMPSVAEIAGPAIGYRDVAVVFLIVAGALVAVATSSRIAAIAGLGTSGVGVALIFISYGAPDVAITQLLVEMLVVVLFSVAALRLPSLPGPLSAVRRTINAVVSIAVGAAFAAVAFLVTTGPLDLRLTEFFEQNSYTEAHGRNIVNVILVDFRALDTSGEIAVVVAAAIAAFALLSQRKTITRRT